MLSTWGLRAHETNSKNAQGKGETAQETDLRVDLRQVLPVECNSWGSDKGAGNSVGRLVFH